MMMAGTDLRVKEAHLRTLRTQHELLKRVCEPLIYSKTEIDFGIEPKLAITPWDIYWTWHYTLHAFIDHVRLILRGQEDKINLNAEMPFNWKLT